MKDRKTASVHRDPDAGYRPTAETPDPSRNDALERMVGLPVAGRRQAVEPAREKEARMLARTVVVEGRRPLSRSKERASGRLVHWKLRTAGQVLHRKPAVMEQPPCHADVARLPAVGSAEEGDLIVAEPEGLLSPRLQQRHGLERLGRGTQVDPAPRDARP